MQTRGDAHRPLQLQPGQVWHEFVEAQTAIQICHGQVALHEPPRWIAERMISPVRHLGSGDVHVVTDPGWVRMETARATSLVTWRLAATQDSAPVVATLWYWLGQLSRAGLQAARRLAALARARSGVLSGQASR